MQDFYYIEIKIFKFDHQEIKFRLILKFFLFFSKFINILKRKFILNMCECQIIIIRDSLKKLRVSYEVKFLG